LGAGGVDPAPLTGPDRRGAERGGLVNVALGSDHAGYRLKLDLEEFLKEEGHGVQDLGTHSEEPVDYPPYCAKVGRAVVNGAADRGIVLGGSGQGEQIAANKVDGVRA